MADSEFWGGALLAAAVVGGIAWSNWPAEKPVKEPLVACKEVYTQPGQNLVMIDKCSGESWMLIKTTITEGKPGKIGTEVFTYRWYTLRSGAGEPELSLGFAN